MTYLIHIQFDIFIFFIFPLLNSGLFCFCIFKLGLQENLGSRASCLVQINLQIWWLPSSLPLRRERVVFAEGADLTHSLDGAHRLAFPWHLKIFESFEGFKK